MKTRAELQLALEELLGSRNVYFQPPESIKLSYPCIVYELNDIEVDAANDSPYLKNKSYSITYIDKNPDNTFIDAISSWALCRFDRFFVTDNLNHYIFTLYF